MKRVLLSALLAATALQASAGIVNGSFELPSDLADWTTFGPAGVYDDPPTSGSTTAGSKSARVTALFRGASNAADLEAFVGVSDGDLRKIKYPLKDPADPTSSGYTRDFFNGGAIQQKITVGPSGDTLFFDWRLLTFESGIHDFSFYVLDGTAFVLGDTGGGTTVFDGGVFDGYTRSTVWLDQNQSPLNPPPKPPSPGIRLDPGDHILSFAVLQGTRPTGEPSGGESRLIVDNVRLASDPGTPIPEPVSLGLVGLGLLAFGCNRRRKA